MSSEWLDRALFVPKVPPRWGDKESSEHIGWRVWRSVAEVEEEIRKSHEKAINMPQKK